MTQSRGEEATKRTGLLRWVTRSRNVRRERDTTRHRIGTCSRGDRERSSADHHRNGSRDAIARFLARRAAREIHILCLLRRCVSCVSFSRPSSFNYPASRQKLARPLPVSTTRKEESDGSNAHRLSASFELSSMGTKRNKKGEFPRAHPASERRDSFMEYNKYKYTYTYTKPNLT